MGKIVAIGGGENGHGETIYETGPFDREIVALTGKKRPNFLFIGLANDFPDEYYQVMKNIYKDIYDCKTDYLTLNDIVSFDTVNAKIQKADIIYVGGGNTSKLIELCHKHDITELLRDAYENTDKVLCGVSAGAICWCRYGDSVDDDTKEVFKVNGFGFLDILICPHSNRESFRLEPLEEMMKETEVPAIAMDNAAIEVVGNEFRVLRLEKGSSCKKCYWKDGKYITKELLYDEFVDIEKLYIMD
ncbi:MAG: type 1 glutamine amidotransferase-like domain-containing protein [Clostridiales bacterium]|nr:type 1 glutamine amidotransferase-like domain-containing protein [Clostridiales bacterium]